MLRSLGRPTPIDSYEGFSISLRIARVLLVSSNTSFGGFSHLQIAFRVSSHLWYKVVSSLSSSATLLPSATVRTIIPQFLGLILCRSCLRRALSSDDFILEEIDTLSVNGISIRKRPASEMSPVSRGPLVDMGSFVIWTRISCPCSSSVVIFPSLFS